MTQAGLGRFFGADGRRFDVIINHGFVGVYSFLAGISTARTIRDRPCP